MFFQLSLLIALVLCAAGLAYKVWSWLSVSVSASEREAGYSPGQRASAVLGGLVRAVFSRKIWPMLKALILDGLLQARSLKHSALAWAAHLLVFSGFTGLLLLHALGDQITNNLFRNFYPTVDPWLWLRDLMGVMVMVGVIIIIVRRIVVPGLRMTTRRTDRVAIGLLAVIMLSGFGLQAVKITSAHVYQRMVEEYSMVEEPAEKLALRSVWAADYGVVFPEGLTSTDPEVLEQGHGLNQDSCVECHAPAQHAFASYGLSRLLAPVALALDRANMPDILYYIHFLACFVGLAILPFTKFLHMFSAPLLMGFNAVVGREEMNPAAKAFYRALELDACTHCGTCSVHCSVAPAVRILPNQTILPSEKLAALDNMVRGNNGARTDTAVVREGAYVCTDCGRCTRLCPVGINLRDLWAALKEDLDQKGLGKPIPELAAKAWQAAEASRHQGQVKVNTAALRKSLGYSAQGANFSECYSCKTCTNACPLVFRTENPAEELDLLPHQVIFSVAVGMKEEAMGARMVWNCLTCYQCQEACPNLVPITDIFYELRNMAAKAARGGEAGA
ncbi:MAG: 4Fe-4S dicluster domain-containing protein [Desulfarculaceae bacterium]|nr:4Fe-4S dicluster domain-containing protein [Desulfarculaceae bacterium]MCF8072309.1 4Fe-4S dicluster domain-containing protein [Desulfarculaceae bacterium]MCF8100230.1 4Fe-4S dicluster domain-containing protein [Desulfarculaceae bacterium]MCF8116197.1 4Fe-4S dicluster domain-containing protein [Desulfarculaceae bacterium]